MIADILTVLLKGMLLLIWFRKHLCLLMHLPVIKTKKRAYHTDHNLKHSLHTVTMR